MAVPNYHCQANSFLVLIFFTSAHKFNKQVAGLLCSEVFTLLRVFPLNQDQINSNFLFNGN